MSLASLGPIVEKCSLNALDKSDGLDIELPFKFNSLTDVLFDLREVRSQQHHRQDRNALYLSLLCTVVCLIDWKSFESSA